LAQEVAPHAGLRTAGFRTAGFSRLEIVRFVACQVGPAEAGGPTGGPTGGLGPALVLLFALASLVSAQVTTRDVDPKQLTAGTDTRAGGVSVFEVMKSARGASIPGMLVALPGAVAPESRPRLLVVAGLNPDHAGGIMVASRLGTEVLDAATADEKLKPLLERFAVEIIPCVALDVVAASRGSRFLPLTRANLRPVDDDRDGAVDEDGPDDLDGDGQIVQMRVPDPLGEWRVSDEDPRLMVKADRAKGQAGTHRLEPEGLDNDDDGAIDEDAAGGVDFDRNFPHGWREFDRRAGTTACSEPETRGLIEHVLANRNVAAILVLGHRDTLVATPPAAKGSNPVPDGIETEDRPLFEAVGELYRKRTGFARGGGDDRPDGAFHQWGYYQYGVPSFAAKAYEWPTPAQATSQPTSQATSQPTSQPTGKKPESDDAKRLADSDSRLGGKGFVAWKPFKHPTLGDVEIGGFVPLSDVNPTADRVPDLARAHARFVLDLLELLPRVSLHDVAAKPLGAGLFELTAVVRNDGRFPTVLRIGTRTRSVLPSRVVVDLPRESFELGERRTMLEPLGSSGQGRKLRWIVRAAPGTKATVTLWTEKAGEVSAPVTFGEPK
jgi:Zinc carboxypeptidase